MFSVAPLPRVAMCRSGLRTSTSPSLLMSPAVTSQGPTASMKTVFTPSLWSLQMSCLMFSTMSVTSSFTPGMVVNSCWTPAILMLVAAVPGRDESMMRRRALPRVVP